MKTSQLTSVMTGVAAMIQTIVFAGTSDAQVGTTSFQDVAALSKFYKIEFVSADGPFVQKMARNEITGTATDANTLQPYFELFAQEFGLYPPELVKKTKLKQVTFCHELQFAGQARTAVPDWEHDVLYLDVGRSARQKTYHRLVIHHEFFHLIDYHDDGSLYRDERWAAMNLQGFSYGTGGKDAQDIKSTSVLTDRFPGFLNHYSTTAVEEDKAEIFAQMLVNPAHVAERANTDPVIAAKVTRMQALLAKFCPKINERFWNTVANYQREPE